MKHRIEVEQLFSTMMQLGKLMSTYAHESHEEKAATMLQFTALNFLIEHPNGTVSELADFLKLSKSSATQLTERLVKAQLVLRMTDINDRRIIRLAITPSGIAEFKKLKEKLIEKISRVFSNIPKEDIHELIRIHTKLITSLKKQQHA